MTQEPEHDGPVGDAADAEAAGDEAALLEAYDLDGDGHVSAVEDARAKLGVIDAQLEAAAEEGGVKGKIAGAAHRIVDRIDND